MCFRKLQALEIDTAINIYIMENATEQAKIIYNDGLQKYQLILPNEVLLYALSILSPAETPNIVHTDRLKLEWLYQDIQKVYEQQKRNEEKREKRDKVKERIYIGLMALLTLLSIFIGKRVAEEIQMPLWTIGLSASVVMIFLFWMYFKTRMGIGFSRNDLIESLEVLKLRMIIQHEFS